MCYLLFNRCTKGFKYIFKMVFYTTCSINRVKRIKKKTQKAQKSGSNKLRKTCGSQEKKTGKPCFTNIEQWMNLAKKSG